MITPNELTLKEQSKTLSSLEIIALKELEEYFDRSIKNSFSYGKATVFDYVWDSEARLKTLESLKSPRKDIIKEILFEKYRENGWDVRFYPGEDDGPNRPGIGYWVFSAK